MAENKPEVKWYFKTPALIIAFLCVGPLALPLLWWNPRFGSRSKILVTCAVIILTWFLGIASIKALKSLSSEYRAIFQNF